MNLVSCQTGHADIHFKGETFDRMLLINAADVDYIDEVFPALFSLKNCEIMNSIFYIFLLGLHYCYMSRGLERIELQYHCL